MDRDDLRNLCIKNNWYTRGNSDEYENLLHVCGGNKKIITTDDVVKIANDILDHSETDYYFEAVCFELFRICHTHIIAIND